MCASRLSLASATASLGDGGGGGGSDARVLPSVDPAVSHPSRRPCQRRRRSSSRRSSPAPGSVNRDCSPNPPVVAQAI